MRQVFDDQVLDRIGHGGRGAFGSSTPLAAGARLRRTAAQGEHRPFGHYRITGTADAVAIGGIGFKGRPVGGSVEIAYGLVPSARGHGYAAEAVLALIGLARRYGLARVVADTDVGNIASQRTLERAGFSRTGTNGNLVLYAIALGD